MQKLCDVYLPFMNRKMLKVFRNWSRPMKKITLLLIFCTFTFIASGQKTTTKTKTSPSPAEIKVAEKKASQLISVVKKNGDRLTGMFVGGDTESVTIEMSGAKIPIPLNEILNINIGTEPEKPVESVTSVEQKQEESSTANLFLEAAVVYRSGDVVPVTRTEFYLMDEDVISLCRKAGVNPTSSTQRTYSNDYSKAIYTDIGFMMRYLQLPDYQKFGASFVNAIKPHIKYTVTTDFNGKATFNNIPKGKYFLFGMGSTRQSGVVWNLNIEFTENSQIILDAKNAAFAY